MSRSQAAAAALATPKVSLPAVPGTERLLSLDVFRGFTLLGMVLVNSHPGPTYPGLGHVRWNGWGFADLIFPFFVFIVGVAMPYSFAHRLDRGESPGKLFRHIALRSLRLFAIGVLLNGYPHFDLATLRVMNVLQRIAICYLLASLIYVYLRLSVRSIVWLCGIILVLYFVLMKFVPVPGYGAGVLEPVGNWGNYLDQKIMPGHMQNGLREGKSLLGSFPALVTMLMGLLTGIYLRTSRPSYEKAAHMSFYGGICMGAGVIWSVWFPINQQLWSSSLVLFMGGIAVVSLAGCYLLVDIKGISWWTTPCIVFGVNSIAVWVFSQLGMKTLMAVSIGTVPLWTACGKSLAGYMGSMAGPLAFAIAFDLFWLAVMWILYRRRIFIRL